MLGILVLTEMEDSFRGALKLEIWKYIVSKLKTTCLSGLGVWEVNRIFLSFLFILFTLFKFFWLNKVLAFIHLFINQILNFRST